MAQTGLLNHLGLYRTSWVKMYCIGGRVGNVRYVRLVTKLKASEEGNAGDL
jgi:hypothetical protein